MFFNGRLLVNERPQGAIPGAQEAKGAATGRGRRDRPGDGWAPASSSLVPRQPSSFAPSHPHFALFSFSLINSDNGNSARPPDTKRAHPIIFSPTRPCPRSRICPTISCFLSHNISTSLTSMPFSWCATTPSPLCSRASLN